ncbi:DUF5689 domain-containing protein [Chryseobacterium sp. JAH]|uniref:DUF5689 domain-containing protein n=1 Tax=Chryseobacterium sp. JAH TaxID=1742858 RepID=UPI00074107D4|nr:DUF5689 domain-containing protein [Chryseobacterium sp. JAH]KUJ51562.1 hypothetical protein AR685_07875 [Chryseobacterium sp. JAH]
MKKNNLLIKYILIIISFLGIIGCVHDDKYDEPNLDSYECADLTATMSLTQLRAKVVNTVFAFSDDSQDVVEGYVSSTDETGNIYKTIYIQDKPENPTQGFVISVDMVSTYTKFPQGSKIYIKLAGLALGTYGGVVQLGIKDPVGTSTSVLRIPEKLISSKIFRSCLVREKIVPKIMTCSEMISANDRFIGCLIQVDNAEFDSRVLCTNFAPNGVTVDRMIKDASTTTARIVRNSGYASFANQILPSGNGKFVGIYSKYISTYQLYINKVSDLEMNKFPRIDGISTNPCEYSDVGLVQKTVAEIKQLATAPLTQITGDFVLKAKVIANDKSGNLFKYIYAEDTSGGIKINIDKNDLFNDSRFAVGKEVYVKLKNLYIGTVSGEMQIGAPFSGAVGRIPEADIYKHFFDSNKPLASIIPTEKMISHINYSDVGRWVKIKDVQFSFQDLERTYAGAIPTNRILEDCLGNQIIVRTSNFADFADATLDSGKGDVYAIVGFFNGTYQLILKDLLGADLDNVRCDGSVYVTLPTINSDEFSSGGFSSDWLTVNVAGAQVWSTSNTGNGTSYYAIMNGFNTTNAANEDWLISKSVSLAGKTKAALSFTSDVRYAGNSLQVYITENYTGDPSTTNWVLLPAVLDSNNLAFGDWTSSGNVSLNAFLGKNIRIAFKYTSTPFASATWEIDDFKIKAQ